MLLRFSILSVALVFLSACSDPIQEARDAVLESLSARADIEFISDQHFDHGSVCGQFKQRDKWGESSGTKRYVYHAGELKVTPGRDVLAVFCSENPAAVIEQRFSLSLASHSPEQLEKLVTDFELLTTALERFYNNHSAYPSTEEGLVALKEKPKAHYGFKNYPETGYLKAIPSDPWQQAYHYQGPVWAGVKSPFALQSNGADAAEGGSGEAADISAELLPYLQLLLELHSL